MEMGFASQPPPVATSGINLAPAVELTFYDAAGNLATLASGTVTLTLFSGTGVLGGGTTAAVSGGSALFDSLVVDLVGSKTLQASTCTVGFFFVCLGCCFCSCCCC